MMGDAMLSSLYREGIFAKTQESFAMQESNMSKGFSVFHDYLGLANLVVQRGPAMQPAQQQPTTNSYYQQALPYQQQLSNLSSGSSDCQLPSPTGSASSSESMEFCSASAMFPHHGSSAQLLHDHGMQSLSMVQHSAGAVSRKRMNSLESDARSESSNSSASDLYLDSASSSHHHDAMSPVLASVPFFPPPPANAAALMMESSLQSIEPILASLQKAPVGSSRLQQAMHNAQQKQKAGGSGSAASKVSVCVFCRNNGESREFYSSHTLKDAEGVTTCPILRAYTCPLCKASGDHSHTIKYCPKYTPKAASPPLTTTAAQRMGLF